MASNIPLPPNKIGTLFVEDPINRSALQSAVGGGGDEGGGADSYGTMLKKMGDMRGIFERVSQGIEISRTNEEKDRSAYYTSVSAKLLDPRSAEGTKKMRSVFAAVTLELEANGGDIAKSETLVGAAKALLSARGIDLAGLKAAERKRTLDALGEELLQTYYNHMADMVELRQELLLLQRPHPAEYMADRLGEWLGIAKNDREKLLSIELSSPDGKKNFWRSASNDINSSPWGYTPFGWVVGAITGLVGNNTARGEWIKETLGKLRASLTIEPGKGQQFEENAETFLNEIADGHKLDAIEALNFAERYNAHHEEYVASAVAKYAELETYKTALRSGDHALFADEEARDAQSLADKLGEDEKAERDEAVERFRSLLDRNKDAQKTADLGDLRGRRLDVEKTVSQLTTAGERADGAHLAAFHIPRAHGSLAWTAADIWEEGPEGDGRSGRGRRDLESNEPLTLSLPAAMVEYGHPSKGWSEGVTSSDVDVIVEAAASWAKKVIERYRDLDEGGKGDILDHIRGAEGLTFTFWIRGIAKDIYEFYEPHEVKISETPEPGETLKNYISRVAKQAGEKVRDYFGEQCTGTRVDYIAVGAKLPLESQVERSHLPLGHRLQASLDLDNGPLIIEYNKDWKESDEYKNVKKHAASLANKIWQYYEFENAKLEEDILYKIQETGGLTFSGWLADTDLDDDNYSFTKRIDLKDGQFDGTLKDYVQKAAEDFAASFITEVKETQGEGDVNIRHIGMRAELANVRVQDEYADFPPEHLIAFGIGGPADEAVSSPDPAGATSAENRQRRHADDKATATLDTVTVGEVETSYQTSATDTAADHPTRVRDQFTKVQNQLATPWAEKVLKQYDGFDDAARKAILEHIGVKGIEFTIQLQNGVSVHEPIQVKRRTWGGETLDRFIRQAAREAIEIASNMLVNEKSSIANFKYITMSAELPLVAHLERALIPEGHAIELDPDLGRQPLFIEHSKSWNNTDDYNAISKHAAKLAEKISQRYSFEDERLEKNILHAIQHTGGITFFGRLADTDFNDNEYVWEKVVDPVSGSFDGTLQGYIRKAAETFAGAYIKHIRDDEGEGAINIEHITMRAELADIRLKDGGPSLPEGLDPASDGGKRAMQAKFAAITQELKANGGDVSKSDTLLEAARSSLKARGIILGQLKPEEAQSALAVEGEELLKTYYNYVVKTIGFQQELLLLHRPHPAEYAAEELGKWLGIAKKYRYRLADEVKQWTSYVYEDGNDGYISEAYLKPMLETARWIDILADDRIRSRLNYSNNESIRKKLIDELRELVDKGKYGKFDKNIVYLFTSDVAGDINNDEIEWSLRNIKDSYDIYYKSYIKESTAVFRKLEAEKILLRSGDSSLISRAKPDALEGLVEELGGGSARKLDAAVAYFRKLLENRRDGNQLHNLESLKRKRLEFARTAFSRFPIVGDFVNLGIDAVRGDWENVAHDALRDAAFAAMFLPAVGPELGSVLFAADATWGEGSSLASYFEAKQRGDDAGAAAAFDGILGNGLGLMMSGIPLVHGSLAARTSEAIALEDFEMKGNINRGGLLGKLIPEQMYADNFPENLSKETPAPKYEGITPKITAFTSLIQEANTYVEEYESSPGGVCAAYVSLWLKKNFNKYDLLLPRLSSAGGVKKFLAELQLDYEAYGTDKGLLARRGMHIDSEFDKTGESGVSEILNSARLKHRRYIYMAVDGEDGAGHAVGLALGNEKPEFFDPNWGVFEFKNYNELAVWVPRYMKKHYKKIHRVTAYSVRS
ncbi:YopT-type cysteine protease domain-containing protein [Chelativorans xinjiangense]|uniref:YopT-type cysteine protease domain-containing protein n=1 Tax=Chelativorans xinjiangense TaxID=2681485 RepID=UPI001358B406|nr:YopT-type cysteine protease domain-containing protein [Chelativorans xinjiangense]